MLPILSAVLSLLVARRAPSHRPISRYLCIAAGIDLATRLLILAPWPRAGPRLRLILAMALLVASARAVGAVYRSAVSPRVCAGILGAATLWIGFAPVPAAWWSLVRPITLAACCLFQCVAWGRGHNGQTIAQRTAAIIVWCDAAGLILGLALGWERIADWGSVEMGGIAAIQTLWLARVKLAGRD